MVDHETKRQADGISMEHRLPACRFRPLAEGLRESPITNHLSPIRSWSRTNGFTLAEILVSIGVLVLLVLLATQLLNSAATITTLGHKRMDADSQARQLLDRMAIDFAQMVKRSDIDYYLKSSQTGVPDCTTCTNQTGGNDRIAFFSTTSGYYPTPSYQSPISLIAYRVNSDASSTNTARSYNKLERMGKGFIWNGVSLSYKPILFLDSATAPTTTIQNTWCQATISGTPSATCTGTPDPDYELIGPQVFRFEYYYLLRGGINPTGGFLSSILSGTPWDTRISGHTAVKGMQDVAAVIVDIAVIDPKSKVLLTDAQISALTSSLIDWGDTGCPGCPTQPQWQTTPGLLQAQWRAAVDANTVGLPRPAISGIRVYERYFYLSPPTLLTP